MPVPIATAGAAMRNVMRREVACIDRALGLQQGLDASVHEARKAIRRLRALLGLCRGQFDGLDDIGGRLQAIGRGLSVLRDAQASIDTARKLAALQAATPWAAAEDRLRQRRQRLVDAALAKDPGFARRRACIASIATTLDGLPWESLSAARLQRALRKSGKRVARAGRRASKAPSARSLHRWRRRLRTLRMQLDVIAEVAPGSASRASATAAGRQGKALRRQADALGWRQDLEVLRRLLRPMRALPGKPGLLAGIREEIDRLGREMSKDVDQGA
jgi:hypothetical protein